MEQEKEQAKISIAQLERYNYAETAMENIVKGGFVALAKTLYFIAIILVKIANKL